MAFSTPLDCKHVKDGSAPCQCSCFNKHLDLVANSKRPGELEICMSFVCLVSIWEMRNILMQITDCFYKATKIC